MTLVELWFDVGPAVGLGHRRRMEALEAAFAAIGATVQMVPLPDDEPLSATRRGDRPDAVVIDSYRHRADDPSVVAGVVAAIDDLDRDLAVDLVVRPRPGAPAGDGVRGDGPTVLEGFEHALLALSAGSSAERQSSDPLSSELSSSAVVLVSLGGADRTGLGARVADVLAGCLDSATVRHAPGPWSVAATAAGVTTVDRTADLVPELLAASVAVVAGGVTMLEALALGTAAVVVVTAGNQRAAADAVAAAGAAVVLDGEDLDAEQLERLVVTIVDEVTELWRDAERRRELARRGRSLVDGRGADRVAAEVLDRCAAAGVEGAGVNG